MCLKMQLMSNDNPREGSSETEPILNESKNAERVDNYSSTFEIRSVGSSNCLIAVEDSHGSDVNENSSLVTSDQPQCRICLDTEGEDLITPCHCRGTQKYVTGHVLTIGGRPGKALLFLTAQNVGQCLHCE